MLTQVVYEWARQHGVEFQTLSVWDGIKAVLVMLCVVTGLFLGLGLLVEFLTWWR